MRLPQFSLRSLFVVILLLSITLSEALEILRLRRTNAMLRQQIVAAQHEKAAAERKTARTQYVLKHRNLVIQHMAKQWQDRIESEKPRAPQP